MKYTYAYKTSDGIRHEDSMNAASREEVFAELRKRGIKAIKVVAADGSKANGEVRGVRKRAVAALVALAAVCAGVVAYFGGTRTAVFYLTRYAPKMSEANRRVDSAKPNPAGVHKHPRPRSFMYRSLVSFSEGYSYYNNFAYFVDLA